MFVKDMNKMNTQMQRARAGSANKKSLVNLGNITPKNNTVKINI